MLSLDNFRTVFFNCDYITSNHYSYTSSPLNKYINWIKQIDDHEQQIKNGVFLLFSLSKYVWAWSYSAALCRYPFAANFRVWSFRIGWGLFRRFCLRCCERVVRGMGRDSSVGRRPWLCERLLLYINNIISMTQVVSYKWYEHKYWSLYPLLKAIKFEAYLVAIKLNEIIVGLMIQTSMTVYLIHSYDSLYILRCFACYHCMLCCRCLPYCPYMLCCPCTIGFPCYFLLCCDYFLQIDSWYSKTSVFLV